MVLCLETNSWFRDLHHVINWCKTQAAQSECAEISLQSTTGKMVFNLSGSCWLKRKKKEEYFEHDATSSEMFIYCHTLFHTVFFIWIVFTSSLDGMKFVKVHCDLLSHLSKRFLPNRIQPKWGWSNLRAHWSFASRFEIGFFFFKCSSEFEWKWSRMSLHLIKKKKWELYLMAFHAIYTHEHLHKVFKLSGLFVLRRLCQKKSASLPNLHCMLEQVKSCLPPTSYFPPAAHLQKQ